ncbi:MAG: class I SAM-dependent methyltransferase [Actinobacteria bacterium]|nr:class I SAM-dependent methyltransferase [Actinomycetota bacterium]
MTGTEPAAPQPGWRPFTLTDPHALGLPDDIVYGATIPGESELRLIGDLEGRRILELGCGAGHNAIRMAMRGARVIAVDPDAEQIDRARAAADAAEVKVELHAGELADLAFLRADGIDVVLSAYGLVGVDDVPRLIRQVHRVLKQEAPLIISLPHPALRMIDPIIGGSLQIRRSWFDQSPTVAELFTMLSRNNYRVDVLAEPAAEPDLAASSGWTDALRAVPPTIIIRARKQGL